MTYIKKNPWPVVLSIAFILIVGAFFYQSSKPEVIAPDNSYKVPTKYIEDGIAADETHIHVVLIVTEETMLTSGLQRPKNYYPHTTALQALEKDYKVNKTGEGKDAFVTSINGVTASEKDKTYWAFSVNEKLSKVGAGSYELQDGDIIEWRLEKY